MGNNISYTNQIDLYTRREFLYPSVYKRSLEVNSLVKPYYLDMFDKLVKEEKFYKAASLSFTIIRESIHGFLQVFMTWANKS